MASSSSPAPDARTNNPVRISRIGSDRLQIHIRDPSGIPELMALVERLERLIEVGYDAIEVVVDALPPQPILRHRHNDKEQRGE